MNSIEELNWSPADCWNPEHLLSDCSERLLEKFEKKYEIALPEDFRRFYLISNGGQPPYSYIRHKDLPEMSFEVRFIGFGSHGRQHPKRHKQDSDWIPPFLMLISDLGFEGPEEKEENSPSYLLMSIDARNSRSIYMVDMVSFMTPIDEPNDIKEFESYPGVWKAADTFNEFLHKLEKC